jgi:N-succinyl-L-ornithine transcarbamylase
LLTVRRNVIVTDEVLDSENSIVIEQANNRTYATISITKKYLKMSNKKPITMVKNWWKHH